MNLVLLLVGLQPWAGSTPSALTRVFVAISVLSLEMQVVTWSHVGTMRTLPLVNGAWAILMLLFWRPKGAADEQPSVSLRQAAPWPAVLLLGAVVLVLNVGLPVEAADPYHLERIAHIEQTGTLEYGLTADSKVNVLGWLYEMLLADLRQLPLVGPLVFRLHGLLGLVLLLVGLGALRSQLRAGSPWPWAVVLVVPTLFHQLVLVKNDLFVTVPGLVVLMWVVMRSATASWSDIVWAFWLIGLTVATKLSSFPLAIVAMAALVVHHRPVWRPLGAAVLGSVLGVLAGGMLFTLAENTRWYGDALQPLAELGNRNGGPIEAATSIGRFAISLVDFGVITRRWWPGRGGWGGTFGLPFIWSVFVLGSLARRVPEARHALWLVAVYFIAFAAVYPDADLAHRMALAPGLLLICLAAHFVATTESVSVWCRRALVPVTILSGAQILRSAVLYWARP